MPVSFATTVHVVTTQELLLSCVPHNSYWAILPKSDIFQCLGKSGNNHRQYVKTYVVFCVHFKPYSLNIYWSKNVANKSCRQNLSMCFTYHTLLLSVLLVPSSLNVKWNTVNVPERERERESASVCVHSWMCMLNNKKNHQNLHKDYHSPLLSSRHETSTYIKGI